MEQSTQLTGDLGMQASFTTIGEALAAIQSQADDSVALSLVERR